MSLPAPYYDDGHGIQIYLGDCRDILPHLLKVDLVLTDPPYGLRENAHRVASRTNAAATIDYGSFDWDFEPASDDRIQMAIGAGANAIMWGGNYFHVMPARGWLVWDKMNSGDFADCELAWTNLPMSVRIFRHRWNGMIRQSENDTRRVHPAQKPIALMKWCIGFSKEAKTLIDPFCGSGSALIAAKDLGLQAIGIEREPKYCEIAVRRLAQEVLPLTTEAP